MNTSKLPKWAQEHINKLQRERDSAVRALDEFTDTQTPSKVYTDDWTCDGKGTGPTIRRMFFQVHSSFTVEHAGVELNIVLRDKYIDLQWHEHKHMLSEIAFVPSGYQSARIMTKENMG